MTLALQRAPDGVRLPTDYLLPGTAALMRLGRGLCRWPLGEPEREGFRFCLEPSGHRSYCPVHGRLAKRRAW